MYFSQYLESEQGSEVISAWLKNNREPWEEVEEKWRKTLSHRKATIMESNAVEIFSLWPAYKDPKGYKLVLKKVLFLCTIINNNFFLIVD